MRNPPPRPKDLPYTLEEMVSKKNVMRQMGKKAAASKPNSPKNQKNPSVKSHKMLGPRPKPGSKEALLPLKSLKPFKGLKTPPRHK